MADKSNNVQALQDAVLVMDCTANDALSQIFTLSSMALSLMETEQAYTSPETLAQLLRAIRTKADESYELIYAKAQEVGCEYTDKSKERRRHACEVANGRRPRPDASPSTQH